MMQAQAPVDAPLQADSRRWRAMLVLALVQFMILVDNSVVNVALPTLQRDLGLADAGVGWVVNGYLLTAGGLLLFGGRLSDLLGRRRLFVTGVVTFAVASLACGVAPTGDILIAGRFAQGVGEALASPAALSMIAMLFTDPEERGKAFGVWGGVTSVAATFGVIFSGVVTALASWRWLFLVNLPVAVFAVAALLRLTQADQAPVGNRNIDLPGAILLTTGLLGIVDGLLAAAEHPWTSVRVLVPMLAGILALSALWVVERRVTQPLIPLGFFRNRVRLSANALTVVLGMAMSGFFLLLTLHLQQVVKLSPLQTALAYLPYMGVNLGFSLLAGRLVHRFGRFLVLLTGFGIGCIGMLALGWSSSNVGGNLAHIIVAAAITGAGLGLCFPTLMGAAMHKVTEADAGIGSGVQTTVGQLGQALGIAAVVILSTRQGAATLASGQPQLAASAGHSLAFYCIAGALAIGGVLTVLIRTYDSDS